VSIAIFSYIHSISRAQKLVLLTKGLVNELISSESWNNTVNVLKERGIIEEQPSSLEDFEYLMKKRAYDLLEKVRNYFSVFRITYNMTDLYLYVMSLDEFKNIITSVINQRSNNNSIRFFKKYLDQLPSTIDELSNTLKGTIYGEALSYALKEGQAKNLSLLLSLLDFYFIKKLSEIVESFRGDWKTYAENIICYYKDYYSISLAIKHKVSTGVVCKVNEEIIKDISSSSSNSDALDILRRTIYSKTINLTTIYDALASLYTIAKINARKNANLTFSSSPFNPSLALALSELIRLDTEDIITIVNAKSLNMKDEEIKKLISFELI